MTFNPDESRDSHGRWTAGGAGAAPTDDPRTLDVSGDEWNKNTAARLEKEYAAARPVMDKMAQEAVAKGETIDTPSDDQGDDDEDVPYTPESWEDMSGDLQEQAGEKYVDDNLSSAFDSEVESWHENGGALEDAKHILAQDVDWKHEALTEYLAAREEAGDPRIPFSVDDLGAAIKIHYEGNGEGKEDPEIKIDDSKLQHPDNEHSPDQLALPGIDAPRPEESLTEKMREDILNHFTTAFNEKAESNASDVEAPEYLKDNAKEYLEESWSGMDDEDKFNYVKNHTDLIDGETPSKSYPAADESTGPIQMPDVFDPMNETSGQDYRNTQRLAKYLSVNRAQQLLVERGKSGDLADDAVLKRDIANADYRLWDGWKDASAGSEGKLIQVAAHEEFGGRLNTTSRGVSVEAAKEYANSNFKAVGGYDGVKALIRAKWETTQYLLDRANMPIVEGYRGLDEVVKSEGRAAGETDYRDFKTGEITPSEKVQVALSGPDVKPGDGGYETKEFIKLPDMHVIRNGAASFTTDPNVANNWRNGVKDKVTIRAEVPRTSVLSVPAYGVNIHSEHEYVVMGTAWKNWDVWYNHAPTFEQSALKPHVVKPPPKVKLDKAEKEHVI